MRNIIQAAKQNVSEIQRRICSLLGHGGNVRFAIVAYRDHQFDTNIEVLPFTTFCCTSRHLESRVGREAMNMNSVIFFVDSSSLGCTARPEQQDMEHDIYVEQQLFLRFARF